MVQWALPLLLLWQYERSVPKIVRISSLSTHHYDLSIYASISNLTFKKERNRNNNITPAATSWPPLRSLAVSLFDHSLNNLRSIEKRLHYCYVFSPSSVVLCTLDRLRYVALLIDAQKHMARDSQRLLPDSGNLIFLTWSRLLSSPICPCIPAAPRSASYQAQGELSRHRERPDTFAGADQYDIYWYDQYGTYGYDVHRHQCRFILLSPAGLDTHQRRGSLLSQRSGYWQVIT